MKVRLGSQLTNISAHLFADDLFRKDGFGGYFSGQTYISLPFPLESVAPADGYRS